MSAPDMRLIGSTGISAIVGMNPYEGPADLYLSVVEGVRREVGDPAARGLELQHAIALSAANVRGWGALEELPPIIHPHGRTWARCSFDYRVALPALVECKSTNERLAHRYGDGTDSLPEEHICQTTWEMWASGERLAYVPVLIASDEIFDLLRRSVRAVGPERTAEIMPEPRIYEVRYDETLAEMLVEAGERFVRDHIEPKIPPPHLERAASFAEYLRRRWPSDTAGMRKATAEEEQTIRMLGERKAALKDLEASTHEIEARVRAMIADAAGLEGSSGKPIVTYRRSKDSTSTDIEAVATELRTMLELRGEPVDHVFAKHTAVRPGSRRLLLKGVG